METQQTYHVVCTSYGVSEGKKINADLVVLASSITDATIQGAKLFRKIYHHNALTVRVVLDLPKFWVD